VEIPDISIITYLLLVMAGFLAGFIDSIAGGGGLIALPALLFAGLPPQLALGTNKLQGTFGTFFAARNYLKHGHASMQDSLKGILWTLAGAATGAGVVQVLSPDLIKPLIPFLLIGVFIYTLFSKNLGSIDRKARLSNNSFFLLAGLSLGFYDGFFGPGTGSFWTLAFMVLLGFNMTKATGYTKIMNFTSNFVALVVFIVGGNVYYRVGLLMAVGQIIGARVGSGLAIKKGVRFIRPLFLLVVLLTILRLASQSWFGQG